MRTNNWTFFRLAIFTCLTGGIASAAMAQGIFDSQKARFKVEIMAKNLNHPWAMAFLPGGGLLITERAGTLRLWKNGQLSRPIRGLPKISAGGQGGLLDVALDPDFKTTSRIFLTFSQVGKGGRGTAVASARLSLKGTPELNNLRIIFSMNRKTNAGVHFGSRIAFAPDKSMFVTIGERGERDRAQDAHDHAGTVIHINRDGTIPANNPFIQGRKALPEIWSIGHRNPQGAAIHPKTGELWTVEHGARGGDEINRPKAGNNYGWPVISYGRHYSGAKIGLGTKAPGMEQPVHYWDPSIAPSGLAFYTGNAFRGWKGNLFVGALKYQMLVRLELKGGKVVHEERLLRNKFGRIRDVRSGPNGALWLLSDDENGKLLRLIPVGS
jgi:glucose/arabinose dehydrogenase